jgi:hypothetical protein
MSDILTGIIGFATFASILLSALADTILSATWTKTYFTSGVLLFVRRISIDAHYTNIPPSSRLNKRLYSFLMGGFIFKELDENKHGFRRKFFCFALNTILHGVIIFDAENRQITVKGYVDWFMISYSIMWLFSVPIMWLTANFTFVEQQSPLMAIGYVTFYCLIVGLMYLMDYYRLKKIATVAAELWSRKYVIN